jgi:integrase
MGYGDGTFWRDQRGIYHFRISVGGKNHHRCTGTKLLSEAKRQAKELRDKLIAAEARGDGLAKLADLKQLLVADYEMRRRKSLATIEKAWKPLASFFGEQATIDYVRQALKNYWPHRAAAGKAPATIRKELAVLKRAWNIACEHDDSLPIPRFPRIEVSNARTGYFASRAELETFTGGMRDPLPDLFAFMYLTGWRLSEVLGLTWRNVKTDQVWLEDSKNGEPRVFPFRYAPTLKAILDRQRARTEAAELSQARVVPWVFHRAGERVRSVTTAWAKAEERTGITKLRHDFRRSAVRNFERSGVSQSVGMALTGIKSAQIYARYARAGKVDLEAGAGKADKLFRSERGSSKVGRLKASR